MKKKDGILPDKIKQGIESLMQELVKLLSMCLHDKAIPKLRQKNRSDSHLHH